MTDPLPAPPLRALGLMPMLPGYEAVRATVAETVASARCELVWLERLLEDWEWLAWLYRSVSECDVVLANPSQHNAFVMYELGIARQRARPTLLLLDAEDSQLSGSLDGSPFLLYSNANLGRFASRLRRDLVALCSVCASTTPALDSRQHYADAIRLFQRLRAETGLTLDTVDEEAFHVRLKHSLAHGTFVPGLTGTALGDAALLAALVRSSRMVPTMAVLRDWRDSQDE